jgi:hypothetical protein
VVINLRRETLVIMSAPSGGVAGDHADYALGEAGENDHGYVVNKTGPGK